MARRDTEIDQDEQGIFRALMDDHRVVEALFDEIGTAVDDPDRAADLFRELALQLMIHSNVEDRVVYLRLEQDDDLAAMIEHARDEHAQVESLLRDLVELVPGDADFGRKLGELERAVLKHVEEEENEVLAQAAKVLARAESRELARRYEAEKEQERDTLLETEPGLGAEIEDEDEVELGAGAAGDDDELDLGEDLGDRSPSHR